MSTRTTGVGAGCSVVLLAMALGHDGAAQTRRTAEFPAQEAESFAAVPVAPGAVAPTSAGPGTQPVAQDAPVPRHRGASPPAGAGHWSEYALSDEEAGRAARQGMPFTADQIEKILELVAGYQETIERASRPSPELRAREIALSLDAREAAPVVAIQKDYTSGVAFVDGTGEPWPVGMVLVEASFGVVTYEGGHTVYFTPTKRFLHGNAVVELARLTTPIVLELRAGKGVVDTRLLARIPRPGPNAHPVTVERTEEFAPGDPVIGALLHGAAPADAQRIEVRGGTARDRAWRLEGAIYLRTATTLLAPQAQASERGANGDTVYRLADTPYAFVSRDGARGRLEFGAAEDG